MEFLLGCIRPSTCISAVPWRRVATTPSCTSAASRTCATFQTFGPLTLLAYLRDKVGRNLLRRLLGGHSGSLGLPAVSLMLCDSVNLFAVTPKSLPPPVEPAPLLAPSLNTPFHAVDEALRDTIITTATTLCSQSIFWCYDSDRQTLVDQLNRQTTQPPNNQRKSDQTPHNVFLLRYLCLDGLHHSRSTITTISNVNDLPKHPIFCLWFPLFCFFSTTGLPNQSTTFFPSSDTSD